MVVILVAAGMMGGLALLLAELTRQQQAVQKNTETYFEVNSLVNLMARTLYDGEACGRTLGVGTSISDGTAIASIVNREGGVVVNTGDKYGNGLLRVKSMELDNTATTGTSGTVDLKVVIKKLSKGVKGQNEVAKTLPLSVEVTTGGNLVKCHHTADNISNIVRDIMTDQTTTLVDTKVETARNQFCTGFGGTYDAVTKTCTLPPPPSPSTPSTPPPADPIPSSYVSVLDSNYSRRVPYHLSDKRKCRTHLTSLYASGECPSAGGPWQIQQHTTETVCYLGWTPFSTFTSTTSCADAKVVAMEMADPNRLSSTPSTIEPLGGYQGYLICDPCYILSTGRFTARCRLIPRVYTVECLPATP